MLITPRPGKEIPRTMLSIFCLFFLFPLNLVCVFVHSSLVGAKVEGASLPGQGRRRGVDPWELFCLMSVSTKCICRLERLRLASNLCLTRHAYCYHNLFFFLGQTNDSPQSDEQLLATCCSYQKKNSCKIHDSASFTSHEPALHVLPQRNVQHIHTSRTTLLIYSFIYLCFICV